MWEKLIARASRPESRERGMSLVEVMVSTSILSIVLLVFFSVMASVQMAVMRQDNLKQTLDQARLAIEQIDHELRSGNVFYDPASENPAYYTMRIYTQTNASTRTPSPGYMCVLWQIDSSQRLLSRMWPPLQPEDATDWRVVATGIVNRSLGESNPANYAFQRDTDPLKGSRTLNISLAVNNDLTHNPTQTVRLQAALTGRNTSYGYPANVCSDLPT